jgi:hypothetical protein
VAERSEALLLIGAIAGTLVALTKPDMDTRTSNCFSVDGKKGCNVGTPIRASLYYQSLDTQTKTDLDHKSTSLLPTARPTSCMSIFGTLTMARRSGTAAVTDIARMSTWRSMAWVTRLVESSRRALLAIPSVRALRPLALLKWSTLKLFGGFVLDIKVTWSVRYLVSSTCIEMMAP